MAVFDSTGSDSAIIGIVEEPPDDGAMLLADRNPMVLFDLAELVPQKRDTDLRDGS